MLERLFGKPPRKDIAPEEVVAFGAARLGAMISEAALIPGCQHFVGINPLTLVTATHL
jgi:molecular chaperone DnaK (HSP70)